jgi:hypothetical protein
VNPAKLRECNFCLHVHLMWWTQIVIIMVALLSPMKEQKATSSEKPVYRQVVLSDLTTCRISQD